MTKRLTPEQEAEVEAIASARCDKAAKIAVAMLRNGIFDAEATDSESARAWWATEAGTRLPSEKTWACVVRLIEPLRYLWAAATAVLANADPSEDAPAVSLVSTEDLDALYNVLIGQVGRRSPATVVKVPPDCGLETICSVCIGSKVVRSEKWAEWFGMEDALREGAKATEDPVFRPGSPKFEEFLAANPYPDEPEEIPCPQCRGIGTEPTELGEALLAFLLPRFAETVRS